MQIVIQWDKVNKVRLMRGWSWAQVARRMGYGEPCLSEIRRGLRKEGWQFIKCLKMVVGLDWNVLLGNPPAPEWKALPCQSPNCVNSYYDPRGRKKAPFCNRCLEKRHRRPKPRSRAYQINFETVRQLVLKLQQGKCARCQGTAEHIHHKDGNWKNNTAENLVGLCQNCHSLTHSFHLDPPSPEEIKK